MNEHPQFGVVAFTVTVERTLPDFWPSAGALGAEHGYIFQSREFIEAWMQSFGSDPRFSPHFVAVRKADGAFVMLLPLSIERRKGVSILTFLDQGQADYNAPVLLGGGQHWDRDGVRSLWTAILDKLPKVDVVLLEKMPATVGPLVNPLHLLADGNDTAASHGNQLGIPWEEVEKSLNRPRDLKKKERALARLMPTTFLIAEDPAQREMLLSHLIEQKQRRYEETNVPGFAENPSALAFLRSATSIFAASGHLMLCALMAGDEVAAVQWGLVQDRTFFALVTSFADGPLAQFSCGKILTYRLMKWLHEHQFAYFDQGFGDEYYKLRNSDTTIALLKMEAAQSLLGWAFLGLRRLRFRLGETPLGRKLRALKWTAVRAV